MSDINVIAISGRVGKAPEIKYTAGGVAVTTFSVAVEGYAKEGDNPTYWFDCKVCNRIAETVASRVPKGGRVFVQGELQQEKWKTAEGANRSRIVILVRSVTIIDWIDVGDTSTKPEPTKPGAEKPQTENPAPVDDGFDDIPF